MTGPDIIFRYFPDLSEEQKDRFGRMEEIYRGINENINLISRKDFDNLYTNHILHSLAIAKFAQFKPGALVADIGTGGGFPGIPLSVMFPQTEFILIDSIRKKTDAVSAVLDNLGLKNVRVINGRAETVDFTADYIVSRAVTDIVTFTGWIWDKIRRGQAGTLPNGIIYLKGGDLSAELEPLNKEYMLTNLSDYFDQEFFETKKIVYIPRK